MPGIYFHEIHATSATLNTPSKVSIYLRFTYAQAVLSDRKAAKAVGLNPDTAAYTKAKPRVRDYMIDHRAAVSEKLVDQEAEGLRKLNIGRDQSRLPTLTPTAPALPIPSSTPKG